MNLVSKISIVSVLLGLSTLGCSDDVEQVYDCSSVCDKYSECVDEDLDKSECVDRCEDNSDADPDFEQKASECEDCIDGESCLDSALDCTDVCAPVIAEST